MKQVVLAGGSGLVGGVLCRAFRTQGWRVTVLTRGAPGRTDRVERVQWDAESGGAWTSVLEGADLLVNLAGTSLQCLHTAANRQRILQSRTRSVKALLSALRETSAPPPVYLQASAVGYYGQEGGAFDEHGPPGHDFLARVCHEWESAFFAGELPGVRRTAFRLGVVLSRDGGMLPRVATLARRFLGGRAGSGRQMISWVHEQDLAAMILHAAHHVLPPVFNATGPTPVSNADFMRTLRGVLRRPWSPPVPVPALWLGGLLMGTDPRLILHGQAAIPSVLQEQSFPFRFADLEPALRDLLPGPRQPPPA